MGWGCERQGSGCVSFNSQENARFCAEAGVRESEPGERCGGEGSGQRGGDLQSCLAVSWLLNSVSKFLCCSPNPQCDGMRRGALGKGLGREYIMRVVPQDGTGVLITKGRYQNSDPRALLRTGRWLSANQEEKPTRTRLSQLWDLGSPEPQDSEE